MSRIILVRHGHVDWLAPERFRGRAELPLSSLGRRQAQAVAGYIAASWKPEAVYTSPLGRCRETGAAVAAHLRLEPQPIEGLADIDYGEWQGLTRQQAKERWPDETELWFRAPHFAVIPGGETLAAVLSRATEALWDIMRHHLDGTVARWVTTALTGCCFSSPWSFRCRAIGTCGRTLAASMNCSTTTAHS